MCGFDSDPVRCCSATNVWSRSYHHRILIWSYGFLIFCISFFSQTFWASNLLVNAAKQISYFRDWLSWERGRIFCAPSKNNVRASTSLRVMRQKPLFLNVLQLNIRSTCNRAGTVFAVGMKFSAHCFEGSFLLGERSTLFFQGRELAGRRTLANTAWLLGWSTAVCSWPCLCSSSCARLAWSPPQIKHRTWLDTSANSWHFSDPWKREEREEIWNCTNLPNTCISQTARN